MRLIVTEKDSAARKIAEILGGKVTTKEHGRGRQKVKSYHFTQGGDESVAVGSSSSPHGNPTPVQEDPPNRGQSGRCAPAKDATRSIQSEAQRIKHSRETYNKSSV